MLLDGNGHSRKFDDIVIADAEPVAVCLINVDRAHGLAGRRIVAVDHLDRLAADVLAQDRVVSVLERRFVDVELVRVHSTLYDGLAKSV